MNESRIQCPADLNKESGRELIAALHDTKLTKGDVVVLDLSATEKMNSLGGAWLIEVANFVHARHGEIRIDGQHGDVAEFIELVRPSLAPAASNGRAHENALEFIGRRGMDFGTELKDFAALLIDAIYWTFIAFFDRRGFRWSLFVDELHEMGVRAVRINALMNFLLGLIIAMLSAAQLEPFGAVIYVADLTVIAFMRELSAIMTAVVVSARTGAAIAAEISTMKVQEEIDALRGMGLNVSQFLVAPKLLAMLVVMPCLVAIGIVAGMAGATVWGVLVMDIDYTAWMREMEAALELEDFLEGMYKTFVFAVIIVLIGCHNGFRVTGGSRGVGLMTTRAVVMDIFAIITIDMIFAWIFYYA